MSSGNSRILERLLRKCKIQQTHFTSKSNKFSLSSVRDIYGYADVDGERPDSIRSLRFLLPNFIWKECPDVVAENCPDWLLPWAMYSERE